MKLIVFILLLIFSCTVFANPRHVNAQGDAQQITFDYQFMKAKVNSVLSNRSISVTILEGKDKGKKITVDYEASNKGEQKLKNGQIIVLGTESSKAAPMHYFVSDAYRLPIVGLAVLLFVLLVLFIAGKKGAGSITGLFISLGVIFYYIIPSILHGKDPVAIALAGAVAILLSTMYIAHGVSKQTTVALISTLIALFLTYGISIVVVSLAFLSGFGNEGAAELKFGATSIINLKGLLLGGIIISTLGALNDVTVTQASAIFQLKKTNSKLTAQELFSKGMEIGKEHSVSLVNTLVLAFAGSSLAFLIFVLLNPLDWPLWVIINSEVVSEEIIKTIAATSGLLLAVPIASLLSAVVSAEEKK